MFYCHLGIIFPYTMFPKLITNFYKIRVCKNFLMLIVPAQNSAMKLKVTNHSDNTKLLCFRLRKYLIEVFFKNMKIVFNEVNPQLFGIIVFTLILYKLK